MSDLCFDWRQGHVLGIELSLELLAQLRISSGHLGDLTDEKIHDRSGVFVIVSQDCDVSNSSFEREPYVEFICAVKSDKKGMPVSARLVQSHVFEDSADCYEFRPWDKFLVSREWLCSRPPTADCKIVTAQCRNKLIRMLARRYQRQALPSAFNNRIAVVRDSIKKHKRKLTSVSTYLRIRPLNEDAAEYTVCPMFVIPAEERIGQEEYNRIKNIMDEFLHGTEKAPESGLICALGKCDGICVEDKGPIAEMGYLADQKYVTLDLLRDFDEWDYDDLSPDEDDERAVSLHNIP